MLTNGERYPGLWPAERPEEARGPSTCIHTQYIHQWNSVGCGCSVTGFLSHSLSRNKIGQRGKWRFGFKLVANMSNKARSLTKSVGVDGPVGRPVRQLELGRPLWEGHLPTPRS